MEAALQEALKCGDETDRAAYMDWLIDHGDPRGALIVAMTNRPERYGRYETGREVLVLLGHPPINEELAVEKGFISGAYLIGAADPALVEKLAPHPLRRVELNFVHGEALDRMDRTGLLRGVTDLKLSMMSEEAVARILGRTTDIESVRLSCMEGREATNAALRQPGLGAVRMIAISASSGAAAIRIPRSRTLEHLSIYASIGALESVFLRDLAECPNVRSLKCTRVTIAADDLAALTAAPMNSLSRIAFMTSGMNDERVRELSTAGWAGNIVELNLGYNSGVTDRSLASLAASSMAASLRCLHLSATGITEGVIEHLSRERFPALETVVMNTSIRDWDPDAISTLSRRGFRVENIDAGFRIVDPADARMAAHFSV